MYCCWLTLWSAARSGVYDPATTTYLRHVGLYVFRTSFLRDKLPRLPASQLQRTEDLEQLRWLEADCVIQTVEVDHAHGGVDTPEQLAALERVLAERRHSSQ